MSVAPRSLPALLCAALASLLLVGAVARVLWTRVDDVRDRPIAADGAGRSLTVIPLVAVSQDGTLQRLTLHTFATDAVRGHEEIDLALATGGAPATVVRGTLSVGGCLYATAEGTRVTRGVLVRFVRTAPCDRGTSGPAAGSISMRLLEREPLSVWVLAPSGAPPADALIVGDAADAAAGFVAALDDRRPLRRLPRGLRHAPRAPAELPVAARAHLHGGQAGTGSAACSRSPAC